MSLTWIARLLLLFGFEDSGWRDFKRRKVDAKKHETLIFLSVSIISYVLSSIYLCFHCCCSWWLWMEVRCAELEIALNLLVSLKVQSSVFLQCLKIKCGKHLIGIVHVHCKLSNWYMLCVLARVQDNLTSLLHTIALSIKRIDPYCK